MAVARLPFCELLNSELVYAPIQPSQTSSEIESEISDLIEELEANEDTLRVWTSLDT
jgi:translational activator of cytochrome c oxidase 1